MGGSPPGFFPRRRTILRRPSPSWAAATRPPAVAADGGTTSLRIDGWLAGWLTAVADGDFFFVFLISIISSPFLNSLLRFDPKKTLQIVVGHGESRGGRRWISREPLFPPCFFWWCLWDFFFLRNLSAASYTCMQTIIIPRSKK